MSKNKNPLIIDTTDQATKGGLLNRRLFLNSIIATSAALTTTRAAYGQEEIVGEGQEEWTLYPGTDALEYGERSRFEINRVKRLIPDYEQDFLDLRLIKYSGRTPHEHLTGTITPNGLHFERSHQGIPDIDPDKHALVIHGMVKNPLKYDINALENYPSVSRKYYMECSGNSAVLFQETPTDQSLQAIHQGPDQLSQKPRRPELHPTSFQR